jgi:nitrogen fixation protein NifZ
MLLQIPLSPRFVGFATKPPARKQTSRPELAPNMTKEIFMALKDLQPGDIVYAASAITNDGSVPHLAENAVIANAGSRGVLINTGHLEEDPERVLYLVRFEDADQELGPPIGCWPEELVDNPPSEQA